MSYILSGFYYANLEENVLGFLRKENTNTASGISELNLLMRLTDDYLLITTEKNNAMLFIEKLCMLSQGNYFKFNMKKLKTNFAINYQKLNSLTNAGGGSGVIGGAGGGGGGGGSKVSQEFPPPLSEGELFSWIGISIDQKSLNIVQNINTRKEGILCTLNINMQTRESVLWLKRKLKSFLMNNVTHYFNANINSKEYAAKTLSKLHIAAAEKYLACCIDFKNFHE